MNVKSLPQRHFSYALIFRPQDKEKAKTYAPTSAEKLACLVRKNPTEWQCLLMKRAYRGKEWDTFGGAADPGELPRATVERELLEESGLQIRDCYFVGSIRRPYHKSELIGHGFVVIPKDVHWISDEPALCVDPEEVASVAYFNVTEISDDEPFLRVLGARIRAFLSADQDADCWKYLSAVGKERCRKAGDDCPSD